MHGASWLTHRGDTAKGTRSQALVLYTWARTGPAGGGFPSGKEIKVRHFLYTHRAKTAPRANYFQRGCVSETRLEARPGWTLVSDQ